jgi:hypothetical protein
MAALAAGCSAMAATVVPEALATLPRCRFRLVTVRRAGSGVTRASSVAAAGVAMEAAAGVPNPSPGLAAWVMPATVGWAVWAAPEAHSSATVVPGVPAVPGEMPGSRAAALVPAAMVVQVELVSG